MIFVQARGKINWTLDILGRRSDGYHLMDMLMQSVELHDTIWLEKSDAITLEAAADENDALSLAICADTISAQEVRYDESNLALKAARALRERARISAGARIRLLKRIPSGAGMGGGSADAAAVLVGLNKLWEARLTHEELCELGLELGADVPFMLTGGLARVGGIGEVITPLRPAPRIWLVMAQPCGGLSTGEVFAAYDALGGGSRPQTDRARAALVGGDIVALASAMGNALEPVSEKMRAAIGDARKALVEAGAVRAMMTGSGSVVYGIFASEASAEAARWTLGGAYPGCFVTHTTDAGITLSEG